MMEWCLVEPKVNKQAYCSVRILSVDRMAIMVALTVLCLLMLMLFSVIFYSFLWCESWNLYLRFRCHFSPLLTSFIYKPLLWWFSWRCYEINIRIVEDAWLVSFLAWSERHHPKAILVIPSKYNSCFHDVLTDW